MPGTVLCSRAITVALGEPPFYGERQPINKRSSFKKRNEWLPRFELLLHQTQHSLVRPLTLHPANERGSEDR